MYITFQQNRVKTQVMTVLTSLFAKKNRKLHKFATTNNNFFKSSLSDMHHRKTYMYINFQQNRVSRSVKSVHTNVFAKIFPSLFSHSDLYCIFLLSLCNMLYNDACLKELFFFNLLLVVANLCKLRFLVFRRNKDY